MNHSTKKLLVIAALGIVLAAPAFAQQAPRRNAHAPRQDWSSRVHVYAPDDYTVWHGNQNSNPDFQLGYSR
jgi:opacity protein-like surface antigen